MRVGVHTDQLFFDAPGGIGTYIRELVPALAALPTAGDSAAQGRDAVAITLFHSSFPGRSAEPWMADFPRLQVPDSIKSLYPQWDLLGRPPLPSELQKLDVLHAPLPAAIPPTVDGQGLVVTVHDLAYEHFPQMFPRQWRWLFKAGLRAAVKRADAIITPSDATASDLMQHTKMSARRLHVIPEACPPPVPGDVDEVIPRLGLPLPYLLHVGTIEPRKNLVRLVRAYRQAVAAGDLPHTLVLAGPLGWQPQKLLAEIAKEGPGRIILTGKLPAADLDAVYRASWAVVYVSLYEGFGLPLLEAFGRGLPVIASSASSIPEVAGDGAVLVDPRSVGDIARGLTQVLTDDVFAADLAARGMERSRRFSWEAAAEATRTVYEGVCR